MMPAIVFLKSHFIFIEFDDRMNVGFAERTLLIVESIFNLIKTINDAVNGFVWGLPAIVCIVGVGILLSIRTRFIQFRRFGYALKATIGKLFSKSEASHGSITPVQAVCTALAATVGTGNIAGVAGAIAIGGPGAVFWMWMSALLGMCTKFSEVTLAVHFRARNAHGDRKSVV